MVLLTGWGELVQGLETGVEQHLHLDPGSECVVTEFDGGGRGKIASCTVPFKQRLQ